MLVGVALAACSAAPATSPPATPPSAVSQGSRVTLYESLDQLVADSSMIVTGKVTAQVASPDGEYTISSFTVDESFAPVGLAASLIDSGIAATSPAAGEVVTIRQFGTSGITTGGPLLTDGGEYLLFLNPTMLPGDAADDFFIVGSEAGLYAAGDGGDYRRLSDDGDLIPETLNPHDSLG